MTRLTDEIYNSQANTSIRAVNSTNGLVDDIDFTNAIWGKETKKHGNYNRHPKKVKNVSMYNKQSIETTDKLLITNGGN